MITAEGLEIADAQRECLRRRELGPTMCIVPEVPFFSEIDELKLPLIIAELSAIIEIQDGSGS